MPGTRWRRAPANGIRDSGVAGHPRPAFELQRIYDPPDGTTARVLVDRLWPRGVKQDDARLDAWLKDVAPTPELRRWYRHDPARFDEFARRYRDELSRPTASDALDWLRQLARQRPVALLTATRDIERSGARVLRDHLAG